MNGLTKRLRIDSNLLQLVLLTVLIFAGMAVLNPERFLRPYVFESITFVAPELGLLAIAMMVAMLTGGIDLSVIGIANLSCILAGLFFHAVGAPRGPELVNLPLPMVGLGVLLALCTGILAGAVNGFLITKLRITPILATIGTGQVFTGICLVLTGGPAVVGFPALWGQIGNGTLLGIAVPLLVFLVVSALVWFLLTRTGFGIDLALIGTNARAAAFAGIRTGRRVFFSYVLTGVLASLAGILLSGRTNAAKSDYGVSYLLQAVLIAVLAGTNPAGGRGNVVAVGLALLALMLLSSGLQMMRFSNFLVDLIWGGFLLLSIALAAWRNRVR
ncbi:ABC transporter permease (plasmid) [Roseomonas gilardii subsp. gilardii]|uniref:ABC transporter permease n=1 Tax=Roseomonas gilardii TaxID=257708 RepID=UPI001FF94FAB|nr:ABC transporter permease [Roseomonas gilardii]UPG74680.1 ABC transporter permease [Roseomonas gilardii subsp. gilardii]